MIHTLHLRPHYFFLLLVLALAVSSPVRLTAQFVTIPDATFVSWLQSNGYSTCLTGNQLDTTCSAVLNATSMSCNAVSIHDLTGVQYFKNLSSLDCSNDSISNIPALPPSLTSFNCNYNILSSLPVLPATITDFECNNNLLDTILPLPPNLNWFDCSYNYSIQYLPVLPTTLSFLFCFYDSISSLPAVLPPGLTWLGVSGNQITGVLPTLPSTLFNLQCASNQLSGLPAIPSGVESVLCEFNPLHSLPALPAPLIELDCRGDSLTVLPALPSALTNLSCGSNQFTSLPALPAGLQYFSVEYSWLLDSLPALPSSLLSLSAQACNLTTLPPLPDSLYSIDCQSNAITSLPPLPDSLYYFRCSFNPLLTCLPQLKRINTLLFDYTGVSCLPNYGTVDNSSPPFSSLPLCGIFNGNSCPVYWNISGQCYYDANNDCIFDSTDAGTNYVKTQLYSGGSLIQQTFTGGQGFYNFASPPNASYTVQVDTSDLPFIVSCPVSGSYSVTLSNLDSLSYNNNFAFQCRTRGFDIGVQSVLNNYIVPRPNTTFTLNTIAGDMSELYGAHCAAGISGQVILVYSGMVSYLGPAPGALTPASVSGDSVTWDIADYGAVNDYSAFNLLFRIDSLAVPGTSLCFYATATPITGDYNPANNVLSYCFPVVNSLDPNEKEVSPPSNIEPSNQWLTYTIRFQNTGSASALNIRITDTLDSNLDPSTFQLLAFSAKNMTQIFGNIVTFNFANINLPDNLASDSASRGYIQYKIKLKSNLPVGTQIQNTAYIYFDLNPALVTNTTLNTISLLVCCGPIPNEVSLLLYPNPAKNYVMVQTDESAVGGILQIRDIMGREILSAPVTRTQFAVTTSSISSGVYFVLLYDLNGIRHTGKLVIE